MRKFAKKIAVFKLFVQKHEKKFLAENYAPPWKISWCRPWWLYREGSQTFSNRISTLSFFLHASCMGVTKKFKVHQLSNSNS